MLAIDQPDGFPNGSLTGPDARMDDRLPTLLGVPPFLIFPCTERNHGAV